ncbi:MAG: ParA family protein [Gemmatimonadales bacterium]|jgi:chromosome partitioning protein
MQVVSVLAQKGGVGKTTTAMSLAAICAEASRTLMVDVDPQGSATWWAENAGERLPFDFTTEQDPAALNTIERLEDVYDVVIVDTPGSLEGRDVLGTVLNVTDYVVVPTEPAPLSVQPLIRTMRELVIPRGIPYRVLVNKVDGRAAGMRDDAFAMLDSQEIRRFRASCRMLSAHAVAPALGQVVTQYPRDRYSIEAAGEYRAVALEMFADWNQRVGRHTQLAVAAHTEGASA